MPRYIDADILKKHGWVLAKIKTDKNGVITKIMSMQIDDAPPADVVPKSEVAELLRLMFNDDCACNYNGNDEWLPEKCKFALTDCPMPQERLGCWMEFVEYGLAELKKKYTEEQV